MFFSKINSKLLHTFFLKKSVCLETGSENSQLCCVEDVVSDSPKKCFTDVPKGMLSQ